MSLSNMVRRTHPLQPILSGLLGIMLLLPASFFILTILVRIFFGSKGLYYSMAPSFLQSPFDLFSWFRTPHAFRESAAQVILGSLLLAILFNLLTVLQFRLLPGRRGWDVQVSYRRYWLNTAVALQSGLLLLVLVAYTLIQHIRY